MLKELKEKLSEEELKEWQEEKKAHYGRDTLASTGNGYIDFSRKSYEEIETRIPLTYDNYLDLQLLSAKDCRHGFERCYYSLSGSHFRGQIEKITKNNICFKRIYIEGDYFNLEGFEDKEDHVWVSRKGFEEFKVGDCVGFLAEPYRYVRTSNGKSIDFGIRNPDLIEKIEPYELPSDEKLLEQKIDALICETCLFREHCYGFCIANEDEKKRLKKELMRIAKGKEKAE